MITLEDVISAYYKCRKNKRNTCNALKFEINWEIECAKLYKDIIDGTYEIGRSIAFIVTRPKKREVFAADFRDRVVHHLVMSRLEPLFEREFIKDNYNCRVEKGTLYGINRLHEQVRECSENYTQPCYIAKFDMQGFFMSIHKPTLLKMLITFIKENYKEDDVDIILELVTKIVNNCPQNNCIKKSLDFMWDDLPANKSLFTVDKDYGLPIGNLTSQMFANFYLNAFDKLMVEKFKYYGRYVDDFFVISKDKKLLLDSIPWIRNYLKDNLKIVLHPKKLYIQYYKKGCKFIGAVVKGKFKYSANRTVAYLHQTIFKFNNLAEKYEHYPAEKAEHFISVLNSYYGFLGKYESYNIRKKYANMISKRWYEVVDIAPDYSKFICKEEYTTKHRLLNKIIQNNY